MNIRKIIITGSVAVGKSSIIKNVLNKLKKTVHVPEYIDYCEDGVEMLNKYFRKEITPFAFQKYILNFYDNYFKNLVLDGDEIMIFERMVDDGITCFSNLDNKRGELSDKEFSQLYEMAKEVDLKYNIPSYFVNKGFTFIPIKTVDSIKDGNMIANIIENRDDNIIIGLYNEPSRCFERMLERNREGEKEAYSKDYINQLCMHYKKLYKILMSEEPLRFTSVGTLL